MHSHPHAHGGGPSCLRAADTNKGCWGFDSTRQAATAQQGWPFTACQPTLLQEAPTKSRRMLDSHKRDDSTTVTSNLRHEGMHKKIDKHTHPCHPPVLPHPCSGTAAGLSDCQSHWCDCSAMSKYCVLPDLLHLSIFSSYQVKDLYRHLMFSLQYQSTFRLQHKMIQR